MTSVLLLCALNCTIVFAADAPPVISPEKEAETKKVDEVKEDLASKRIAPDDPQVEAVLQNGVDAIQKKKDEVKTAASALNTQHDLFKATEELCDHQSFCLNGVNNQAQLSGDQLSQLNKKQAELDSEIKKRNDQIDEVKSAKEEEKSIIENDDSLSDKEKAEKLKKISADIDRLEKVKKLYTEEIEQGAGKRIKEQMPQRQAMAKNLQTAGQSGADRMNGAPTKVASSPDSTNRAPTSSGGNNGDSNTGTANNSGAQTSQSPTPGNTAQQSAPSEQKPQSGMPSAGGAGGNSAGNGGQSSKDQQNSSNRSLASDGTKSEENSAGKNRAIETNFAAIDKPITLNGNSAKKMGANNVIDAGSSANNGNTLPEYNKDAATFSYKFAQNAAGMSFRSSGASVAGGGGRRGGGGTGNSAKSVDMAPETKGVLSNFDSGSLDEGNSSLNLSSYDTSSGSVDSILGDLNIPSIESLTNEEMTKLGQEIPGFDTLLAANGGVLPEALAGENFTRENIERAVLENEQASLGYTAGDHVTLFMRIHSSLTTSQKKGRVSRHAGIN